MEDLMRELIDVLRDTNGGLDWASIISAICSVISLTAIIILLKERSEKKRPYLQASFELIRSSLTCIVIRNVGEVPARLFGIIFSDFIKQLPQKVQDRLGNMSNINISIYPKQQLVICLDVITADILKFTDNKLKIVLKYSSVVNKHTKKYIEDSEITFGDYAGFLIYISETDELRKSIVEIGKSLDKATEILKTNFYNSIKDPRFENCSSMDDSYSRVISTDLDRKEDDID
jgi:hypothetical protein